MSQLSPEPLPGFLALGRDAAALAALYPAHPAPETAAWRPGPLRIPADLRALADRMPDYGH